MPRFNRFRRKHKTYHYDRKSFIMTEAEMGFFRMLMQAFGAEYYVFPQVHLSAILDERLQDQSWDAAREHIERKSVDYVLCDKKTIRSRVAIELDDWSHSLPIRRQRDAEVERILGEAGVPLARFHDYQTLSMDVMEYKIRQKMQQATRPEPSEQQLP